MKESLNELEKIAMGIRDKQKDCLTSGLPPVTIADEIKKLDRLQMKIWDVIEDFRDE